MYKCSECGQEFNEKPDFCDCGNDTFEQIVSEKSAPQNNIPSNQPEVSKIEPSYKKNMPSIIFLIISIILSFITLFFVGNPKDEPKKEEDKKETVRNIPDIDTFWDNTKAKQQAVQKSGIKPAIKEETKIAPAPEPKIARVELKKEPVSVNKPVVTVQKQPVQKQTAPKQQVQKQTAQTQTQVKKPSSQTKPQQVQPQTTKPQAQSQTKPQTVQQTQTVTPQQPKQQTQNVQTTVPKPQVQTSNIEEMKQYKKALRNKIASNIDFLNIAGDGKCSLSFSISQGGALLNRKFVSQSQNSSLNDAVYQAMLKVSSFKAPPSSYKNETLKLTVRISGGNFEVSLE